MLSRFVTAFLPRGKHLLVSWLQSPSVVILEPRKINCGFKPTVLLSSFTLIKRFFSSSLLSAIRVVSFVYLRLLIFLLAILIPACASSSPAFHMMYSAYWSNKQGDSMQTFFFFFSVYSLNVLLSQFGTSSLFHVWF